jgi:hypothetical protein
MSLKTKFQSPYFKAIIFGATLSLGAASMAHGATIYSCSDDQKRCVVKQFDGSVGHSVTVMDEKARVVAKGKVLRRKGNYAVVELSEIFREIRKAYPVMVDIEKEDSEFQWTASFPDRSTR